jgi:hypothetical protein
MKLRGCRVVSYRSICGVCVSPNTRAFNVPDDTWEMVVPPEYQDETVCIGCFETFVNDKQLELFRAVWSEGRPSPKKSPN